MKSIIVVIIYMIAVADCVKAQVFLDSIINSSLPCNIIEYEQKDRQKLSNHLIVDNFKQLYDASVDYYTLGKIKSNDLIVFIIEAKKEDVVHGYLCKYKHSTKEFSYYEIVHFDAQCLFKLFCLDNQSVRVTQIVKDNNSGFLKTETFELKDGNNPTENTFLYGLPKNIKELKNTKSIQLTPQYVKEYILQVQNCEYNNYLPLQYCWYGKTPSKELGCGIMEVNDGYEQTGFLCIYESNRQYPKMLKLFEIKGYAPVTDYCIIGSSIQIISIVDIGERVFLRTEIYQLNENSVLERKYINPHLETLKTSKFEIIEEFID